MAIEVKAALLRAPVPLNFGYVATGLFDAEGAAIRLPPLFTSTDSVFPVTRRPAPGSRPVLEGLHLWGGAAFDAFGHWLTETFPALANLRPLLDRHPEAPVLMVLRPGSPMPAWGPLHRAFADRLGLSLDRIRIVTQDVTVERLILPEDPFGQANHYRPGTISALDALSFAPAQASGRALFLSRRKLSARNDRTPNIAEVEETFAAQGYEILHPETLTLEEQMQTLLGARHLAGENGSALHWSLYSPHVRSVLSLGWELKLQSGICAARGQFCRSLRYPVLGRLMGRKQRVPLGVVRQGIAAAKGAAGV